MGSVGLAKITALLLAVSPVGASESVTLLALGDSLTQGFGLVPQDGFVAQLDAWLEGQGAVVDLINAGVSGDTTAGGAARVAWSLTPEVDAMIVALGANDMLRGLDPDEAHRNLTTILDIASENELPVLLVGIEAPANYGPDYKTSFDAIYPDLATAYDTLLFPNFFEGLGEADFAALQPYFQDDGIHPNAEGVARIVEAMGPSVLTLIERAE